MKGNYIAPIPQGAHLLALGAFNSDQRHYVSLALRNGTWFLFDGPTAKASRAAVMLRQRWASSFACLRRHAYVTRQCLQDLGSWDKAVQYLVNKRFVPWEALYEKSNGESAGLPASPKAVMKQAEKRRAPQVVSVEVVRRPRVAAKRSFLTPSQNVRGEQARAGQRCSNVPVTWPGVLVLRLKQLDLKGITYFIWSHSQATPAFSSVADTVAEEAPAALCPVPPSMDWDGRHYTIISSDCPDIGIPIRSPAKRSGTRRAAQHDMSGGLLGLFFGPGAVGQGHQAQGRDAHVDGSGRVTLKQGSPVVGPAPSRSLPSKQRRRMPCAVEDSDMEYPHASSAKEGSVLSTWQRHQPARRERNGRFSLTRRPTGGSVTDTDTASLGSPSSSGSSRERWRSADNRFDMLADNLSLLPEAAKEDERLGRDMSSAALPVAPESNHHGQRQHDVFTGRKVSTVLQTSLRRAMSARPALRLRGGGGDPPSSPSSGVDILMAGASTNEAAVDECPRCCKKRQKNWQRSAEGRQGWQWGWQWDGADGAETGPREHGR